MYRKAAVVLALAASFLGAQAMDLPKARELTGQNKNHTKAAKHNSGVKSKAKTVELCIERTLFDGGELTLTNRPTGFTNSLVGITGAAVYECADVKADGSGLVTPAPTPIGSVGMTCHGFSTPGTRALCQTELTLNTQWHKTAQTSSIVGSFFADADKLMLNPPILTMVDPVVTGTTGAWGKVDNIQSVSLSQIGTTGKYYKLTIGYKGRGWNPAAAF